MRSSASARGVQPSKNALSSAITGLRLLLLCESDLFHEPAIVPEQLLFSHHSMLPVSNLAHDELKGFAGRRDGHAVTHRHRVRQRTSTSDPRFASRHTRRFLDASISYCSVAAVRMTRTPSRPEPI